MDYQNMGINIRTNKD